MNGVYVTDEESGRKSIPLLKPQPKNGTQQLTLKERQQVYLGDPIKICTDNGGMYDNVQNICIWEAFKPMKLEKLINGSNSYEYKTGEISIENDHICKMYDSNAEYLAGVNGSGGVCTWTFANINNNVKNSGQKCRSVGGVFNKVDGSCGDYEDNFHKICFREKWNDAKAKLPPPIAKYDITKIKNACDTLSDEADKASCQSQVKKCRKTCTDENIKTITNEKIKGIFKSAYITTDDDNYTKMPTITLKNDKCDDATLTKKVKERFCTAYLKGEWTSSDNKCTKNIKKICASDLKLYNYHGSNDTSQDRCIFDWNEAKDRYVVPDKDIINPPQIPSSNKSE